MLHALLRRNLRHHGRMLLSLLLGFALLEALICWIGSQIETGPGLEEMIRQFLPPAFQELIRGQIGMASFSGMVAFGFQHPAIIAASMVFVMVVSTLPAAEREAGLLDLWLARPVPRHQYVSAVALTLVVGSVLLPAALLAGAAVMLSVVEIDGELAWHRYLPAAGGLTTLLLAVGGYTLLFASAARRRGPAVARAAGLTLTFYLVDFLAAIWSPLEALRWLTPFQYFKPIQSIVTGGAPGMNAIVLLGIFVVCTAAAHLVFRRQDL